MVSIYIMWFFCVKLPLLGTILVNILIYITLCSYIINVVIIVNRLLHDVTFINSCNKSNWKTGKLTQSENFVNIAYANSIHSCTIFWHKVIYNHVSKLNKHLSQFWLNQWVFQSYPINFSTAAFMVSCSWQRHGNLFSVYTQSHALILSTCPWLNIKTEWSLATNDLWHLVTKC